MNELFDSAIWLGGAVAAGLWRATWQGAILISLIWLAERAFAQMPATLRSWLWRGVYLKLLVALAIPGTIGLPVLPASSPAMSPAVTDTTWLAETAGIDPIALGGATGHDADSSDATVLPSAGEFGYVNIQALLGGLVAVGWLAGCAWFLARLVASHRRAAQLGKQAAALADPLVKQVYRQLGYQF